MPSTLRLHSLRCLCLAAALSLLQAPLRAESSLPDYGDCLDGFAGALVQPLKDAQAAQTKHRLGLAVAGIRELATGQRSPLCLRLESDLADKLRAWTIFKPASSTKTAEALASLDGETTDLSQGEVLRKLGQRLKADLVLSGSYEIEGSAVMLKLRLLRCSDNQTLWTESSAFPAAQVVPGETDLVAGTQPLSYVKVISIAAPLSPSADAVAATGTAVALSPAATVAAVAIPPAPSSSRWEDYRSLADESTFSWTRLSLGAGYKAFLPQNPTFAAVAGNLRGAYFMGSWADVFNAEIDLWSQRQSVLADIGSLFAYGVSFSATVPWRPGPYAVLYGGLGTRLESITVSSPKIPSNDSVSFGNNSFFGTAGCKLHRGPYGVDGDLTYDFFATDSPYLTVKLGLYYEFNLQ